MLPSRDGRSTFRSAPFAVFLILICACVASAAEKPKGERKAKGTPTPIGDLTSIPLPVGHEAKGLVLPNFDIEGHLIGRLEATSAKRTDVEHVFFSGLKLTTFTPENQTDLLIEMIDSTLDLKTRVISSEHRTTIKRADFDIVGDTLEFDTISRRGTLVGNVKMEITGKHSLAAAKNEKADE